MTLIFSFLGFLIIILSIGLYAKKFSQNTSEDYLLASGEVPLWQATISAMASAYSGFMYIGLIGYTYTRGISGIWLILFWVLGEFFMMYYAPKRINQVTKKQQLVSYSALISNYWPNPQQWTKKIAAMITLIFLSIYVAAQFNAAGKALSTMLNWQVETGIIIAYVIVLAYCFSGGIRASIWTDIVQFFIMLVSMSVLVFMALNTLGGWDIFIDKLYQNPASYTAFFPDSMGSLFFIILFLLGWVFAGLGVVGQPHIAVRFMALKKTKKYRNMLYLYYSCASVFTLLCLLSALLAKVYFSEIGLIDFDAETALPRLAIAILPPVLVGLILSGIFAAIVSTADSQILSCSAALGNDLLPEKQGIAAKLRQNKLATITVATFALLVAIYGGSSVFLLVLVAWSGLASAFAPILILYFLGYKTPQNINIMMMLAGLSAAVIWRILGLSTLTYEALIGIVTGFIIFIICKQFSPITRDRNTI
ncbi:MAG: sodium/proline symporter [Methylococcales symbiont of Hymedesmia sp. n. MRB-2018]|nr:MAG: sodium/proline symporter [Methylococcales symbiont of Hymedesmia sp. n. MRB-2018]KAF3984366.1 MAG: sodium/proline symporter [Methylococcales symbiont of Hymedesmia sp. n. MRB-2018]